MNEAIIQCLLLAGKQWDSGRRRPRNQVRWQRYRYTSNGHQKYVLPWNEAMNAARHLLKRPISCWNGDQSLVVLSLNDNTRPHCHASVFSWVEQKCIQRWLQFAYSSDLGPWDYKAFHLIKRTTGGDLFREAIYWKVTYGKANDRYIDV